MLIIFLARFNAFRRVLVPLGTFWGTPDPVAGCLYLLEQVGLHERKEKEDF